MQKPALYGIDEMQRMGLIAKLNKLSKSKGVGWDDVQEEIGMLGSLPELSAHVVPAQKKVATDPDFNPDGTAKQDNGAPEGDQAPPPA